MTSAVQAIVVLIAIRGAAHGHGPFASSSATTNVLQLQLVLIALSLPLMFLAAIVREREGTAEALRISEREGRLTNERYREVVDSQRELVCRFLPDTTLTFVNDAYCRYFGKSREDLLGRKFIELIPPDAREGSLRHLQSLLDQPRTETMEHEVLMSDGTVGWQQWVDHVIVDAYGKVVECQGIGIDVTQRRRAEDELRQNESALRASYEQIQDLAGRLIVAQEAERTRIARELHDGINQQVASLSISLSGLKRKLPPTHQQLQNEVADLQRATNALADDVRGLSHDLHPGVLQHAGLIDALQAHCREFEAQHRISTSFSGDIESHTIGDSVSLCLYRIAQEALHNVARHAAATNANVLIERSNGTLRMIVTDNGRGFEPAQARRGAGLGLTSIEERARLVRGTVCIESKSKVGTKLIVQVPIGEYDHVPT